MNTSLQQTAVIIPARNEQESLPLVVRDLPNVGLIIVANNGSTDETAQVAVDAGCIVANESVPGYGRACLTGLARLDEHIAQHPQKPTGEAIQYVAFLDGDYSDDPGQLPALLSPIVEGDFDFVLGSRLSGDREQGAMPPQAVWGNRLACFLMRWIWKTDYSDLGPFRVIRLESLRQLEMSDQNFGWTVEMQIKAAVRGLRTCEVPVSYRCRIGVSKISGTVSGTIRAGYKILYTIAKYAWQTKR